MGFAHVTNVLSFLRDLLCAKTILNIRKRLAWRRPPTTARGHRNSVN
jgi:hypothetical protein